MAILTGLSEWFVVVDWVVREMRWMDEDVDVDAKREM